MLLFLLLPFLALAYVGWHVWCLLPLAWGWKVLAVLLMIGAFMLLFASIFRATDRLPMLLATAVYEVGTSSIFVLLYLFMLFLVLDAARLLHLVPAGWLRQNWWPSSTIVRLLQKSIAFSACKGCECEAKLRITCGRIVVITLKNEFDTAITRVGAGASQILFMKSEIGL